MGYYKIKNITNNLPKRHSMKDVDLKLDVKEGLIKGEYNLKSGEEIAISCQSIPVDIQKLRIKGHVTISEISENQFQGLIKKDQTKNKSSMVNIAKEKSNSKVNKESDSKKLSTSTTTKKESSDDSDDKKKSDSNSTSSKSKTSSSSTKTSEKSED